MDAEFVLATRFGIIIAAFVAEQWLPATIEHFPGREPVDGRFGFVGGEAPDHIKRQYLGKRLPDLFRKPGAANPIRYTSVMIVLAPSSCFHSPEFGNKFVRARSANFFWHRSPIENSNGTFAAARFNRHTSCIK